MYCTPNYKCPIGSVPKATNKKDYKDITYGLPPTPSTATKWYVYIISKPSGKRNMPSMPKLSYTF
nr:hypothetical protein [uncultured bacterium]